jgi:hypothetical protein
MPVRAASVATAAADASGARVRPVTARAAASRPAGRPFPVGRQQRQPAAPLPPAPLSETGEVQAGPHVETPIIRAVHPQPATHPAVSGVLSQRPRAQGAVRLA